MATTRTISGEVIVEERRTLVPITCSGCGVLFAMTTDYIAERRKDHKTWHCPNGCDQYYPSETPLEKQLREAKARLEAERGWASRVEQDLAAERKQHASTKGQLTKAKKRASAGVCLHCNRTFQNVARHMSSKHTGLRDD
jgi:hypothetical protein